jgi:hypothetical protein
MASPNKKHKTTSEEASQALAVKARDALLAEASKDWQQARTAAVGAAKLEVEALEHLRLAGIKLREAAHKEVPTLSWFKSVQESLPSDMSFNGMQFCLYLARKFDKPFQSIEDAKAARRSLFETFAMSTAPRRIGQQTAHERNPWNEFVSAASGLQSLFSDLDEDPLSEWCEDKLRTLTSTLEPIVKQYQEAMRVLKGQ